MELSNVLMNRTLLDGSGNMGLSSLFGSMGDFYDSGATRDAKFAGNRRNTSHGDSRINTSKYRQYWEPSAEESKDEDDLAEELVSRAILSATMNDDDDDSFGIARPNDTSGRKPRDYINQPRRKIVPIESLIKGEKYKKSPNKLERKIKRVKNGQDSADDVIYMAEEVPPGSTQPPPGMPPGPTICLPLHTYRRMISAEITAEGRFMQEYYAHSVQCLMNEKDVALRSQIFWQDRAKKTEQECEFFADEARHLRTINEHLRAEILALKEAKRRRRSAKKQRNRLSCTQSTSRIAELENAEGGGDEASDKE